DPQTGKPGPVLAHPDGVCSLAFHKNTLATGTLDGTVRFWDTERGTETTSFRLPGTKGESAYPVRALAFSPDGGRLAVAGGGIAVAGSHPFGPSTKEVLIYDVKTRQPGPPWKGHLAANCLLWGPDGKTLVTAGRIDDGGHLGGL